VPNPEAKRMQIAGGNLRKALTLAICSMAVHPRHMFLHHEEPACSSYMVSIAAEHNLFGLTNSLGAVLFTIHVLESLKNTSPADISFSVNGNGYGSIIPGLVKPTNQTPCRSNPIQINAIPVLLGCCPAMRKFSIPRSESSFEVMHELFQRYFQIIPLPLPDVPEGTLGLHYRGTDRIGSGMSAYLSIEEFVLLLTDFLTRNTFYFFYIASDVQEFVNSIYRHFPEKHLMSLDQQRSTNGSSEGLHFTKAINATTEAMALAAMIDLLTLSRCAVVFKTASSFSSFAKVLNPNVKLITVTSSRFDPLFPEGVPTNYYSSQCASPEAAQILRRTLERPKDVATRSARLFPSTLCRAAACSFLND